MKNIENYLIAKCKGNTSDELLAQEYAKIKNKKISTYLGKGHFGSAFLTEDNFVIKITTDIREAYTALQIVGKEHDNVAAIFSVDKVMESKYAIEQEYVPHDSNADELYWELTSIVDRNGFEDINELLDQENIGELVDENLHEILKQFKSAENFMRANGVEDGGLDLQSDNFSFNNGKIKVFDSSTRILSKEQIKNKLDVFFNNKRKAKIKNI
jgi:hypothetical protein